MDAEQSAHDHELDETKVIFERGDEESEEYNASSFGGFREYMKHKKMKLANQQNALVVAAQADGKTYPQIFDGLIIHVNGYVNPSHRVIREMIVLRGGTFMHYLDGKTAVTHIVASNLTPKKKVEFARYKVAKPEWILDSVKQETLLPWEDYQLILPPVSQRVISFGPPTSTDTLRQRDDVPDTDQVESDSSRVLATSSDPALASPAVARKALQPASTMSDQEWYAANTSVNPDFIAKYYQSSRLHHLSQWKAQLKELMKDVQPRVKPTNRSKNSQRYILHCDLDAFFATASLLSRPDLKDRPVVVSHGQGTQQKALPGGDVASCNYVARKYGVRNGMGINVAREHCPELTVLPYDFERYQSISMDVYAILLSIADDLQPVSVDEALLDVSSYITAPPQDEKACNEQIMSVCTDIRKRIMEKTGCEASCGVGHNVLQAKLAIKKAKPNGQYYLRASELTEFLQDVQLDSLPGVGWSLGRKLQDKGWETIKDLLPISKNDLQELLGPKTGETMWKYARGIDDRLLKSETERKSVSAEVNWGIRFETQEQVRSFMVNLAQELSSRLQTLETKGRHLTVKIMRRKADAPEAPKHLGHGSCDNFSKAFLLGVPTDDATIIAIESQKLLDSYGFAPADLRGLGIQMQKLEKASAVSSQKMLNFISAMEAPSIIKETDDLRGTDSTEIVPLTSPAVVSDEVAPKMPSSPTSRGTQYDIPSASQIDPSVLTELPEDVRRRISFKTPVKKKSVRSADVFKTPIVALPSQSRIDPSVLEALPDDVRREIESAYGIQDAGRKRKRSPEPTGATSLTQACGPQDTNKAKVTKTSPLKDRILELGLDYEVLKELPVDMQREVIADAKRAKMRSMANKTPTRPRVSRQIKIKMIEPTKEPTLMGKSSLEDVRQILSEWVAEFSDEVPDDADIDSVRQYFGKVLDARDVEKCQLVVLWWAHLVDELDAMADIKQGWKAALDSVTAYVNGRVQSMYGGILDM